LEKREKPLKENSDTENAATLLLANYIQNNSSYLNQVNNQFSDLSIRRANLGLELENIETQIISFQGEIDKLNIDKGFISNLKIIAQPRIIPGPISPDKKRILAITIVMALFVSIFVAFLQELAWKRLIV
jgi:uncharacterized protein involved in exopolysaccharide biosynthesis